jgi:hypothetical protein
MLGFLAAATLFSAIDFAYDNTHLHGIYVDGACILGDDVHTNGMYLIGSADGSDAQGHSIISVGGSGGRMKSDDPAHITGPEYQLAFHRIAFNRLGFSMSVGPMPQDFEAFSLPCDFGRKMMDRFRFDGDHFKIFSSENDGEFSGSGAEYSLIKPKAEIRDIHQKLIGKVGGASTELPVKWAEVDGPYATVRFTITQSTRYSQVVFFNHPGTHNLEFGFEKMTKGAVAALAGEITVIPKGGPSEWVYDGPSEFYHQIGRAEKDGWSVSVSDTPNAYMCFGPYAREVGAGPRTARFTLMLDNVDNDNAPVLTIDVADAATGTVLASRQITRGQFSRPNQFQDFDLSFVSPPGSKLEFRTQSHGISYIKESKVTVFRG